MSKTVFISSTYRDLKEHRKQVWDVLQAFDVNITGMEEFGARKSTILQTCLNELELSDIYIGIISMCYGSTDSMTGKSYTQLEYDKAQELGLETLIYLIDENNGEIKTGKIDYGNNKFSLDNFKRILKANHTVDFFVNEKDLGNKLFKRLNMLLPSDDIKLDRPQKLDAKIYRIKFKETAWFIFVGFLYGKPFEVFSTIADEEFGVILPKSVDAGVLTQRLDDGVLYYDFSFSNVRGYITTIEGINLYRKSDILSEKTTIYSKIISKMLQSGENKKTLFSIINESDATDTRYREWYKEIVKILEPLL